MRKQNLIKYTRQVPGGNKASPAPKKMASKSVKDADVAKAKVFSTSESSARLVNIRNESNEVTPRQPIDPVPPKPTK